MTVRRKLLANVAFVLTSRQDFALDPAWSFWGKFVAPVLALLLIWGGIGLSLTDDWEQLDAGALRNATNLAAVAEQGIARTIEAVDQRLLFARDAFRRDPGRFSLSFIGAGSGYNDGMMMQLSLIGKDGVLVDSNLGPTQHVDLSDREHFRIHLVDPVDRLFISRPVMGRVSKRWSVQFTRKVYGPDGGFAGVVVGSLDPTWLTSFLQALDGRGSLTLVGDDDIVRAVAPDLSQIGQRLSGALSAAVAASRGSAFHQGEGDAVAAVGLRRLAHYPLRVLVALDMEPQVKLHAQRVRSRCLLGLVLSLLAVLAALRLHATRARLLAWRRELRSAVDNIDEGLVMVDRAGRIRISNRRFQELLGLSPEQAERGVDYAALTARQLAEGQTDARGLPAAAIPRADDPADARSTCLDERTLADGAVLEVRAKLLDDGGAVCTFADITARRRAQERIHRLAHYDTLTGLANRSLMRENLQKAIDTARRSRTRFAVLCLDLDRFKPVNDSLGHAAGDTLLRTMAERMIAAVRETDIVARFGGDEFVILATATEQAADAAALAERLIAATTLPVRLQMQDIVVGASIGIALYPDDGETVDALLHNADTALYRAKDGGRGALCFFEAGMEQKLRARSELEADIRQALVNEEFSLFFQPLYGCQDRDLACYEALVRWHHPRRGLVSPADFIPVAEECGLILPLGRWIVHEACRLAAGWSQPHSIAVNISPVQFKRTDLVDLVRAALEASGLDPRRLELEVTEGVLMDDAVGALSVMRQLKALGVRFALDDFGTGYSSLSYLQRFPFDKIKIDKSFVQALETNDSAEVIVTAILAIGRSLKMRITAEGVETEEQLDFLRRNACDEVQGYLLGRPMPAPTIRGSAFMGHEPRDAATGRPEAVPAPAGLEPVGEALAAAE